MDRRLFLLTATAGVADPELRSFGLGGGEPARLTGWQSGQDSVGPQPYGSFSAGESAFDVWRRSFIQRSEAAGWPSAFLHRELDGVVPDYSVVRLDRGQPEFSRPVGVYVQGAMSEQRIATGRARLAALPALNRIEPRFGVPAPVVIGIWAMETSYGANIGSSDVVRVLATLAAEGRRRDWAEQQLWAALRMIDTGEATRAQMVGSWAGAMGQTQFIPATYLASAVDFDGDGKRDVWGSTADALGSAANLLRTEGWRPGEGWAREVRLPGGFDYGQTEGPKLSPAEWRRQGVQLTGGGWSAADEGSTWQLALPAGAGGPAFLLGPNHFAIRKYNNSVAYALAVGLLADRIAGRGPLVTPWPAETPLALDQRRRAQQALTRLGFDTDGVDGVVGAGTRRALRGWQASRNLPADGYLTPAVIDRLAAEAQL